jgi:hypothetical protein
MENMPLALDIPLGEVGVPRFQLTLPVFFLPDFDERLVTYLCLSEQTVRSGIYVAEGSQDRWEIWGPYTFPFTNATMLKMLLIDNRRDLLAGEIFRFVSDELLVEQDHIVPSTKLNHTDDVRIQLLLPASLIIHPDYTCTIFMFLSGDNLVPGIYTSEQFGDLWVVQEEHSFSIQDGFRTILIQPINTVRSLFAKEKLRLVRTISNEEDYEQSLLLLLSQPTGSGQRRTVIRIISECIFVDESAMPIQNVATRNTTFKSLTEDTLVPGIFTSEQFGDQWELEKADNEESPLQAHKGYREYMSLWIKPIGKPRNVYPGEIMSLKEPKELHT